MSLDLDLLRGEPRACDLPEEEAARQITEPFQEVAQEIKEPFRQMRRDVLEPLRWLRIERQEKALPRASRRPVGRTAPRTRRVRTASRGSPGGDDSSDEDVDLRRAA